MDLDKARETIEAQDNFLRNITEAANPYGTVVAVDGNFLVVSGADKLHRAQSHPEAGVGDIVVIASETGQILEVSGLAALGSMATVTRVFTDHRVELELGDGRAVRAVSRHVDRSKLRPGIQVVMDTSNMVVMEIQDTAVTKYAATATDVHWDHIGGNEAAKRELREAIQLIRGGTALHTAYKVKAPKGLLLYGPPGCGKTMLGKAAATELAADGHGAFMYVKAPELLSKYVGVAEANIRNIFEAARRSHEVTGQAAVVFFDEADAIMQKRGTGVSSDMEKTIVPTFLTEMDGLESSHALVILATNRPDTLDPAIIREGRIDRRIEVCRPEQQHGQDIFTINLNGIPLAPGHSAEQLAQAGVLALYRPDSPAAKAISGALIANAVDRAKRGAIRRESFGETTNGLTVQDITQAIVELEGEY